MDSPRSFAPRPRWQACASGRNHHHRSHPPPDYSLPGLRQPPRWLFAKCTQCYSPLRREDAMIRIRMHLTANQIALVALVLSIVSSIGAVIQWWSSGTDEKIHAAIDLSDRYLDHAVDIAVTKRRAAWGKTRMRTTRASRCRRPDWNTAPYWPIADFSIGNICRSVSLATSYSGPMRWGLRPRRSVKLILASARPVRSPTRRRRPARRPHSRNDCPFELSNQGHPEQ